MAQHGQARAMKDHFVAFIGEFVGTYLFLFIAFLATQIANAPSSATTNQVGPNLPNLMFISLAFGFSLAVNAWVFYRVSGGLFNPAVTLGMVIIGALPPVRGVFVFVAQILGGIAAAAVAKGIVPGDGVLFNCALAGNTSVAQGLFIEMFLTAQLIITIYLLAVEKHKATFMAPLAIGLALFISELGGVYFTGGALNPARALGPHVVGIAFPNYHWIYWIGPFLGAILASAFYLMMRALNFWEANPDQDKAHDPEATPGDLDYNNNKNNQKSANADTNSHSRSHSQHRNSHSAHGNGNGNPNNNGASPYAAYNTVQATQPNGYADPYTQQQQPPLQQGPTRRNGSGRSANGQQRSTNGTQSQRRSINRDSGYAGHELAYRGPPSKSYSGEYQEAPSGYVRRSGDAIGGVPLGAPEYVNVAKVGGGGGVGRVNASGLDQRRSLEGSGRAPAGQVGSY